MATPDLDVNLTCIWFSEVDSVFLRKSEVSKQTISVVNYSLTIHQKQIKASSITPLKVKIKQTNKYYFWQKGGRQKGNRTRKYVYKILKRLYRNCKLFPNRFDLGKC